MKIETFEMERAQCLWENRVDVNLSESGVSPLRPEELLEGADPGELLTRKLGYPPSRGTAELRERIAAFHPGAGADEVVVTNGTSEANQVSLWGLVEADDRVAVMIPNYLQTRGLARAYGEGADEFRLVERGDGPGARWALDVDGLEEAVDERTRLIVVTNPNNPTGGVLDEEEMEAVVRCAERSGAWILADEVYRGAELGGETTPTFWGRTERVLVTGGASKAYGLPGLRIGWIVGPSETISELCRYRDYTTLMASALSDLLASRALEASRREAILARTREILRRNLGILGDWVDARPDTFSWIRPRAGAIALLRLEIDVDPVELFERLLHERSVLVTPGPHFGIGPYLRVGYGYDPDKLREGLGRFGDLLEELP